MVKPYTHSNYRKNYILNCLKKKYLWKRHIINIVLHVIIITAIGALIVKYSKLAVVIFFILSTIALAFYKYVENNYLKKIGEDAND